jgi:hypothetical protein
VGFHKMVSELMIWRVSEQGLFLEVKGQVVVSHGEGIKGGLGKTFPALWHSSG